MSHLSPETLARLADEAPSMEEAAHLQDCEACRVDRDALREDVQALAMLPDMTPPPDAWAAIESRLIGEGLIRERSRYAPAMPRLMQAAAAVVLFLAGSLTGRMLAAPQPLTTAQTDAVGAPADTRPDARPGAQPDPRNVAPIGDPSTVPDDAPAPHALQPAAPRPDSNMRLASSAPVTSPRTIEEATELLRQTEDLYLSALTRYAELAMQSDAGDPIARLAALQSIVMTTNAALSQTPADPVINGVHLAALAQRDAALGQVAAVTGERWY